MSGTGLETVFTEDELASSTDLVDCRQENSNTQSGSTTASLGHTTVDFHFEEDYSEGETILDGNVTVSGKERHLQLKSKGLKLTSCKSEKKDKQEVLFLVWRDIIQVEKESKDSEQQEQTTFLLHHINRRSNSVLRLETVKIEDFGGHGEKWINIIYDQCHKVRGRPHKLFVLINPIGGAGKGRQIYLKSVAPLLALAEIQTTVLTTEKSKHALEIGETHDFSLYDGIVIVGGDGLYQELLQGYTIQIQKRSGVNYHSSEAEFAKPNIPIGIIPAGTGNGVSGWVNGTIDIETAVLNIIRGENRRAEIFTVHSREKFVCISALVFGYGMFSDMIKRTDELRWMKKARYPYAAAVTLFKKKRVFKCELTYRLRKDLTSTDPCNNSTENKLDPDKQEQNHNSDWITYTKSNNRYCGIFSFACDAVDLEDRCVINPFGSHVQLGIDTGCGQIALLKSLIKFSTGKKAPSTTPQNLDFISNVTAFRIKLLRDDTETDDSVSGARAKARELENLLDIDGEVVYVENPEMEVRLHVSFVPLYGCIRMNRTEVANGK
ncbi:unnamed protein product [Lymnaea stagnalis]|uniref:DAGKc domain-containing protein n=1 Tax=Lymnaea stagnalis TaxID=6523 RepID=A0AAV2I043_LYMST